MEENNKLIAEFLGWEKIYLEGCVAYTLPESLADPIYKLDSRFILEFDSNWNWLMEVVEKIEKEFCSTNIHYYSQKQIYSVDFSGFNIKYEESEYGNNKLKILYESVIKFINFYNKQKEE